MPTEKNRDTSAVKQLTKIMCFNDSCLLTVLHSEPGTWDKHNQAYQALQVSSLVYGGKNDLHLTVLSK